ncbi:MAG: exodeoxyribonuclease V subunit alpha, partial [Planctomycetota bacterium]|nr:exodeoxyribonuclease V subunit alpha [Planctomycetota bacterium]
LFFPSLAEWQEELRAADAVVASGNAPSVAMRPLVLMADRLYLRRFWEYEQRAIAAVRNLVASAALPLPPSPHLAQWFAEIFAPEETLPRLAGFFALTRRLLLLSGGPGTGKTYTAARIAAILQAAQPDLRLRLAAPTGKAANRLRECLADAGAKLPPGLAEALAHIPAPTTLHRLLGARGDGSGFRYGPQRPLPADIVMVDEASMLPLSLFAALLDALAPQARLILIGDHQQLASVEAGSILADLCTAAGNATAISSALRRTYTAFLGSAAAAPLPSPAKAPLADALVILQISRRFPPHEPIGRLIQAVLGADSPAAAEEALALLRHFAADANSRIRWLAEPCPPPHEICEIIRRGYAPLKEARSPQAALDAIKRFRILCAVRHGKWGVEGLNALAESALIAADGRKSLRGPRRGFYEGQAVMVTENCYNLNLFNGDLGVVMSSSGKLYAYFEAAETAVHEPRRLPVGLLPSCETAFATTIHKAQGSEFENILIVLPPDDSPLLTKELLYTALTRIKPNPARPAESGEVVLWCTAEIFRQAALRRTERISGIASALAQDHNDSISKPAVAARR